MNQKDPIQPRGQRWGQRPRAPDRFGTWSQILPPGQQLWGDGASCGGVPGPGRIQSTQTCGRLPVLLDRDSAEGAVHRSSGLSGGREQQEGAPPPPPSPPIALPICLSPGQAPTKAECRVWSWVLPSLLDAVLSCQRDKAVRFLHERRGRFSRTHLQHRPVPMAWAHPRQAPEG